MLTVEKIFDLTSKTYDKVEEGIFKEYTDITLENTRKYLKPEYLVIDFGCATGTKALLLADSVKKIVAIDISSKMIALAKEKAECYKNKNITFVQTSIFDEGLEKESFDVVFAFNVLHLQEDAGKVANRIFDLLKPGGLFISTTPCLAERMKFFQRAKFFPVQILMKLKIMSSIRCFKFNELEEILNHKNLQIIEARKYFLELSEYFIVAKKNLR